MKNLHARTSSALLRPARRTVVDVRNFRGPSSSTAVKGKFTVQLPTKQLGVSKIDSILDWFETRVIADRKERSPSLHMYVDSEEARTHVLREMLTRDMSNVEVHVSSEGNVARGKPIEGEMEVTLIPDFGQDIWSILSQSKSDRSLGHKFDKIGHKNLTNSLCPLTRTVREASGPVIVARCSPTVVEKRRDRARATHTPRNERVIALGCACSRTSKAMVKPAVLG